MEANNTKTGEANDGPPGYYENPGCTTAFENPMASEHSVETGYQPQDGFPPPAAYTPQPGYPTPLEYLPPPGYPPQLGYPQQLGYATQPPVLQQVQQQQTVIIQNPQTQYIDNKMTAAILVTFFCFLPTGIAAIVYADKANTFARNGNITGANEANATARRFIIASIVVGCVCVVLAIILPFIIGAAGFAAAASRSDKPLYYSDNSY